MGNAKRRESRICRLARLVGAESKASQQRTLPEVLSKAGKRKEVEEGDPL